MNLLELLPDNPPIPQWCTIRRRFEEDEYAEEGLRRYEGEMTRWKLKKFIRRRRQQMGRNINALDEVQVRLKKCTIIKVRNLFAHDVHTNKLPTGRLAFFRRFEAVLKALVKLCPAVQERYDQYEFSKLIQREKNKDNALLMFTSSLIINYINCLGFVVQFRFTLWVVK